MFIHSSNTAKYQIQYFHSISKFNQHRFQNIRLQINKRYLKYKTKQINKKNKNKTNK